MPDFSQYAKGVLLMPSVTDVDVETLKKFDFGIVYSGKGVEESGRAVNADKLLAACAAANIPALLYHEDDIEIMIGWGYKPEVWPKKESDPHVKIIARQVFSGYADPTTRKKRHVHGLILGMNKTYETSKKHIPASWITAGAEHIGTQSFHATGLPWYAYIDPERAEEYDHAQGDEDLPVWLKRQGGISTFFYAKSIAAGVHTSIPLPNDSDWAEFRERRAESGLGHADRIFFWCYSTGTVKMNGIKYSTGAPALLPLYLYMGSKAELYAALNFRSNADPIPGDPDPSDPDPSDPDPSDPKPSGDLQSALLAALDAAAAAWIEARSRRDG